MAVHDVTAEAREAVAPFEVLGFAVVATGGDAALLELAGRFAPDAWPAGHALRLVVDAVDGQRVEASPTTAVGDARTGAWRAGFAVPLAALDAGGFALALPRLLVELPVPDVMGDGAPQLVRLAREANALRRDLDAALARAAAAETREQAARAPLAAARARAEEQVAAARERAQAEVAQARAEVRDELAAARAHAEQACAEAEQERARAAQERARMEEEHAAALARAEERVAGAHALGDERAAAAEAQAAEQLAAWWEELQSQANGAVADQDVTAVAPAADDATIELSADGDDALGEEPTAVTAVAAGDDPTAVRAPERMRGAVALPPPSAPPLPPDWTRPVAVVVLVLATLVFLLVLAGALS